MLSFSLITRGQAPPEGDRTFLSGSSSELYTPYNLCSCSPILHHTRRYRNGATLDFTGPAELTITRAIYCTFAQTQ
jgi:hypothetical protein